MDTNKQVPVFVHISKKRLKRGLLFHSEIDDHFNSMFDTLVYTASISIPVPQRNVTDTIRTKFAASDTLRLLGLAL